MVLLSEPEAKKLLRKAGIAVNDGVLTNSREEAVAAAEKMGLPAVLKIASPDIAHKSDWGGVRLDLKTAAQVGRAYDNILKAAHQHHPKARIDGVSVQKMARPGVEVIIGMYQDAQFGPVLIFGLGGIWVEALKDVAFRVIPISRRDAAKMLREIKGHALLDSFRGQGPVDIASLEEMLLKVSEFVEANPQIQELDLNPVLAYSHGALAVDARIVLKARAAILGRGGLC
jgi:acetyl-CoA synthetase (ADP-forming)